MHRGVLRPVQALCAAGLLSISLATSASSATFYDWVPDLGFGGSGFIEFDTSAQTAADFTGLQPVAFTFDFQSNAVPVVTLADLDVPTDTPWDASGGVLIDGELVESGDFFSDTGLQLTFESNSADCFAFGSDSCTGVGPGEDILYNGTWELRTEDVPPIPLPAAAWLFLAALGSLGLVRRLKPKSA